MMRARKYNEKGIVSDFSVLSCFRVRWGRSEPFLAISFEDGEADTEAHAMELTSLYPPPCISLAEILLLAGAVLLIGFLVIKLRSEKKENALLFERILDVDARYGKGTMQLLQSHQAEVDGLKKRMDDVAQRVLPEFCPPYVPPSPQHGSEPRDLLDSEKPKPGDIPKGQDLRWGPPEDEPSDDDIDFFV